MGKEASSCFLFTSPNKTIRITKTCNGVGIDVDVSLDDLIPKGTTAQRPSNPSDGFLRYNTTTHLYEYWNADTEEWVEWGTGSGGGSTIYTGASPSNITVGGLPAGTDLTGMELSAIIEKMLITYLYPAFSAFNISGVSQAVETGTTISGAKNFTWSFANGSNVQSGTLDVRDITASSTLLSNGSIIGPFNTTINVTHTTPTSHVWRVSADNTNGDEFTADFVINWYHSRYWGWSAASVPTNLEILARNSELSTSGSKSLFTIPVTGVNRYIYFAYPASFGLLSSIVIGGFESLATFNQSTQVVTNAHGVSTMYNVYVSQNVFSVDITNIVTT